MDTLSLLLALAGALATASGCSLRYDPDDLGGSGAGSDANPDPGPEGPDDLYVHRVFPADVFEGEGFAADPDDLQKVRAVPVVLFGQNLTPDTEITVSGDGFLIQVVDAEVSPDGKWAAFELRLPIVDNTGDVDLFINLVDGDQNHESKIVHHLLPELVPEPGSGGGSTVTIRTDDLVTDEHGLAHFSRVDLSGYVQPTGAAPFRVVAYGGITMSAVIAAGGVGATAGAGGCDGGAQEEPADCAPAGGGAGAAVLAAPGGGGGGGFGTTGGPGEGAEGGSAGMATGEPNLVPMPPAGGARPGGGGGGSAALLAEAGIGGGSGGIVELSTPGLLRATNAVVQADGAAGARCDTTLTSSGAGGGGSGGAVMVRAGGVAGIDGGSPSLQVSARHGAGGTCTGGGGGGAGGVGRIRLDLSDPVASTDGAEAAVFIGPAFASSSIPAVTTDPLLPVAVRGEQGSSYELLITSPEGDSDIQRTRTEMVATPGPEGTGEKAVELWEGFNRLCLRVVPNADPDSLPEAANCLNVAYISR